MEVSKTNTHVPALDGLRGLAIILVFLFHAYGYLPPMYSSTRHYLNQGWVGVDLFFVLSGFLITNILLNTRESPGYFRNFYARRFLRIFPLYYFVLLLVLVVSSFVDPSITKQILPPPSEYKWYFLYLTNWQACFSGLPPHNWLWHFWTLAIEEQFYLLWPLGVLLVPSGSLRRVAIGFSLVALFARLAWFAYRGIDFAVAAYTFTRLDSLLVGAVCATIRRDAAAMHAVRKWLVPTALLTLGGLLIKLYDWKAYPEMMVTIDCTILAIGFGAVILLAAEHGTILNRLFSNGGLKVVGKYSYGIYVYHPLVIGILGGFVLDHFIPGPITLPKSLLAIGIMALLTFLISAISYELFERRILNYKRYFEYQPSNQREQVEEPLGQLPVVVNAKKT